MALILCKRCSKKISSKARICPKCGYNYEEAAQRKQIQQIFLIFAGIVYLLMWVIQFAFTLLTTLFVLGVMLLVKQNLAKAWLSQYLPDPEKVHKVFCGTLIANAVLIFGLSMYFYVYQPWLEFRQLNELANVRTTSTNNKLDTKIFLLT